MSALKVKFDKQLTSTINELAARHSVTRQEIIHSALSLFKLISDADAEAGAAAAAHDRPNFVPLATQLTKIVRAYLNEWVTPRDRVAPKVSYSASGAGSAGAGSI